MVLASLRPPLRLCSLQQPSSLAGRPCGSLLGARLRACRQRARTYSRGQVQVQAFKVAERKWWEEHTAPNVFHISSAQDLAEKLASVGEKLVIVDFFAKWCVACRALYPELCKLARCNPDLVVLCVCYDDNKELCKAMGVKNIPFFHFYRNKAKVASFSAGVSKLWLIKDAIAKFRPLPAL